jgi:CubicO group peptidase (beta-lactamase class C family)
MRILPLLSLCVAYQAALGQDLAGFSAKLDSLRHELAIPGMSVAVLSGDQTVLARGFGLADVAHNIPATEHTLYPIASLTKPFAATLFLKLLQEGKVSLDDPLSKFHKDFQTDRVRVRHIMTHTAAAFTPGSRPGDRYAYSGSFYGYLTFVVAQASHLGFRQLLADSILEPLAMTESVPGHDVFGSLASGDSIRPTLRTKYAESLTRLAVPYALFGDGNLVAPYPPPGVNAAAGLLSTVVDLAKFDVALNHNVLLRPETQQLAWTNQHANDGTEIPYGLGWFVQRVHDQRAVWHYGQWPMFSGLFLKLPDKKLTLIVLANSTGLSAPFDLDRGDVLASPFAVAFLRLIAGAQLPPSVDDEASRAIRSYRSSRNMNEP